MLGLQESWSDKSLKRVASNKSLSLVQNALKSDNLLEHGLQNLDNALSSFDKNASVLANIMNSTESRDKVFKMVQSMCKIGRYVYGVRLPDAEMFEKFENVHLFTKVSRTYLKLFCTSSFIRLFLRVARFEKMSFLKVAAMGRLGALAIYFGVHYPIWFYQTRFFEDNGKQNLRMWSRIALVSVMISVICSFIMDLHRMRDLDNQISSVVAQRVDCRRSLTQAKAGGEGGETGRDEVEEFAVEDRKLELLQYELRLSRMDLLVNFSKDVIDFSVCLNDFLYLGWHDGIQGVCGVLASAISLQRLWKRSMKEVLEKQHAQAPQK